MLRFSAFSSIKIPREHFLSFDLLLNTDELLIYNKDFEYGVEDFV